MRGLRRTFILGCLVCGLATATSAQAATGVAVSVTPSVNPSIVGQLVTFTVTVVTQPRGQPLPAGTATLFVDWTSATSSDRNDYHVPLSLSGDTGTGTHPVAFRDLGTHEVYANWNSTDSTPSGTSPTLIQTVNVAPTDPTTTRLTLSPSAAVFGADLSAVAAVTDAADPSRVPTGDVTFESDGASVGDSYLDPAGHASVDLNNLAIGVHSIVAVYAGQPATDTDVGWLGSTSPAAAATVSPMPDPTETTLSATLNPVRSGQRLTLIAGVTDANTSSSMPTGSVAFVDDGRAIATSPVSSVGYARATVRLSGRGDHLVVAEYRPAGAWLASSSGEFDVLVLPPSHVSAPRACTSRLRTLPLHIVRGSHVSWVDYLIDGREQAISRRPPTFKVDVAVARLHHGRHRVTAVLHYISKGRNHPVKSLSGRFSVC